MVQTSFYLDIRHVEEGKEAPLKIRLSFKGKTAYINLGVKLRKDCWDSKRQRVVRVSNAASVMRYATERKLQVDNALYRLVERGQLRGFGAKEARDAILKEIDPSVADKDLFVPRFKRYIESRRSDGTKNVYSHSLAKVMEYDPNAYSKSFDDITREWAQGFVKFLADKGLKKNTMNSHVKCVKAVFNDAIDDGITTNYPLRKINVSMAPTRKRNLSAEQLATLFTFPVDDFRKEYLDYFKLTFYLIGINPVDLLNARRGDVKDGRLVYKRAKTGKTYDIKITPDAAEIIERYKGREHLLRFVERGRNVKSFCQCANSALKSIGMEETPKTTRGRRGRKPRVVTPLFPDISIYWARHTWATIAYSIGIPDETIAAALGHSHGNRTTAIYIDKSVAAVDDANRRVIDCVRDAILSLTDKHKG